MKNKSLGNQGLVTSSIGLGCMGMSEFYGESNDAESIKTIHRAFELGITFFDTADMYGPFKNEETELPTAAALFLLCKGAAKVKETN